MPQRDDTTRGRAEQAVDAVDAPRLGVQVGHLSFGPDRVRLDLRDDGVAVVTLDRPPHNYIDAEDMAALAQALAAAAEHGARSVVLASNGRNFCAGASLQSKLGGGVDFSMYDQIPALFAQPLPVIAAVQGKAIGAGLGLALVADFRVSCDRTSFVAPFTRLGFHHGFALSVTLPHVVGRQHSLEMLIAGKEISGHRALSIGLADAFVTEQNLMAHALRMAHDIAARGPLAVRAVRVGLRGGIAEEVAQALRAERAVQEELMQTDDFVEGVASAAERREPRFRGR
jgi:2-(1,2-epoxy-1,2-dihydrophenyl)acetyl-CoA isomerase